MKRKRSAKNFRGVETVYVNQLLQLSATTNLIKLCKKFFLRLFIHLKFLLYL